MSSIGNNIGLHWKIQPNTRYGVSSVSNIYRPKGEVDQAAKAVFRLGKQDTPYGTEQVKFETPAPLQQLETIKAARENSQSVRVDLSADSSKAVIPSKMLPPPTPTTAVDLFVDTQSRPDHIKDKTTVSKFHPARLPETLVKIDSPVIVNVTRPSTIPTKDRMVMIYNSNPTHKRDARNGDTSVVRTYGLPPSSTHAETLQDRKHKSGPLPVAYSNSLPANAVDHISNTRQSTAKFAARQEQLQANRAGLNATPKPNQPDDFQFDTDPTMNNNYQKRSGMRRRMGRLTLNQDQDNAVSPINDTIVPFRTNYYGEH